MPTRPTGIITSTSTDTTTVGRSLGSVAGYSAHGIPSEVTIEGVDWMVDNRQASNDATAWLENIAEGKTRAWELDPIVFEISGGSATLNMFGCFNVSRGIDEPVYNNGYYEPPWFITTSEITIVSGGATVYNNRAKFYPSGPSSSYWVSFPGGHTNMQGIYQSLVLDGYNKIPFLSQSATVTVIPRLIMRGFQHGFRHPLYDTARTDVEIFDSQFCVLVLNNGDADGFNGLTTANIAVENIVQADIDRIGV